MPEGGAASGEGGHQAHTHTTTRRFLPVAAWRFQWA
jgi:hypothetical protein